MVGLLAELSVWFAVAGSGFARLPPMRSLCTCVALGVIAAALPLPTGLREAGAMPSTVSKPAEPASPRLGTGRRVYTLAHCLGLAQRNYPKIAEAHARLRQKEAQRMESRYAPFSEFKVRGALGPAPTVRGTSVYSQNTDAALSDNMGLFWRIGVEGVVPLWTFGKIEGLWDAADAQVVVGTHELEKAKNELRIDVRRAFYGLQLARDARLLIRRASETIDDYLDKLQRSVDEGEGDDVELVKTRMYRAELDAKASEAREQTAGALAALRFLTGVTGSFDIPDEPLTRIQHVLAPLPHYLAAARIYRPEVNMARAGIRAREAQLRLAESMFYPDIGVGLTVNWSAAPEVTDQRNPFVKDQGNFLSYGAALVLEWKLDLLPRAAQLAKANAELEMMRATERYALGGVGLEVEKAYQHVVEAAVRLDAFDRATGYAKQWVIKIQQGIDIGTADEEELIEPAKEYALKQFAQMSAVHDYNIALAQLAQATGWAGMLHEGD